MKTAIINGNIFLGMPPTFSLSLNAIMGRLRVSFETSFLSWSTKIIYVNFLFTVHLDDSFGSGILLWLIGWMKIFLLRLRQLSWSINIFSTPFSLDGFFKFFNCLSRWDVTSGGGLFLRWDSLIWIGFYGESTRLFSINVSSLVNVLSFPFFIKS